MKNKRGNVSVIAIIIVIVTVTAGVVGWMFAKKTQSPVQQVAINQPIVPVTQTQAVSQSILVDETANWQTYSSAKYGFEIKYPQDWINLESGPFDGDVIYQLFVTNNTKLTISGLDSNPGGKSSDEILYEIEVMKKSKNPCGIRKDNCWNIGDNKMYSFVILNSNNNTQKGKADIMEKIISTLKFTN